MCINGKYQDENAAATVACKSCVKGQRAQAKETICGACTSGKFQELEAAIEYKCKFCAAGTFFVSTTEACSICEAGEYQNEAAKESVDCVTCPEGRYQPDAAVSADQHDTLSDCLFCSAGTKFVSKILACTNCDGGQYQHENAGPSVMCKFCAVAKEFVNPATACSSCAAGKYQNEDAKENVDCKFCARGRKYVDQDSQCQICPAGEYQDQDDQLSPVCKTCESLGLPSKHLVNTGAVDPTDAQYHDDPSDCEVCPAGTEHVSFTEECAGCGPGQFTTGGLETCNTCGKAKYVADKFGGPAPHECLPCPSGYYQELDVAEEFQCKLCEKGRQHVDASTACEVCPGGQYQNSLDTLNATCLACPDGKFLIDAVEPERHDDINKCLFCSAGKYFEDQSTLCSDCVGGRYQNEDAWANAACKSCGSGQFSSQGDTPCSNCAEGKFQELEVALEYHCKFCVPGKQFINTQIACQICTSGQYQNDSQVPSAMCKECLVGRFLVDNQIDAVNHNDESDCLFCEAGKSYTNPLTPCADCLGGKYQDENQGYSVTCKFCAAGKFYQSVSQSCAACPEGKYQEENAKNQAVCKFCVAGTEFVDTESTCRNCDAGQYQHENAEIQVACKFCLTGEYFTQVNTKCAPCLTGMYQDETQTEQISGGTGYREVECKFCQPGKDFVDTKNACSFCDVGKYQEETSKASALCESCPKGYAYTNTTLPCALCINGKYQDSNTLSGATCLTCNKGTFSLDNTQPCGSCPPGQFQDKTEAPEYACHICPGGYAFYRAVGPCTECVSGKYQVGVEAGASCLECNTPGKYAPDSMTPCTDCLPPLHQLIMPNDKYACTECAPGKRFDGIDKECFGCGTGQYTSASKDSCDTCEKGKATSGPDDTSCRECVSGYYQDQDISTINARPLEPDVPNKYLCSTCPAGWGYQKMNRACKECVVGKFQNISHKLRIPNEKCKFCLAGLYYINETTQCGTCVNGQYQTENSKYSASCESCGIGRAAPTRREACETCSEGRFMELNQSNVYECKFCQAGKEFFSITQSCNDCDAGKYQGRNDLRGSVCKFCEIGRYYNETYMPCENCTIGYFQPSNTEFNAKCKYCDKGRYGNEYGMQVELSSNPIVPGCRVCIKGKWQDAFAEPKCKSCGAGKFSLKAGLTSADGCDGKCSQGKFSEVAVTADDQCTLCPTGRWSNEEGLTRRDFCRVCGPGRYNPYEGRKETCDFCPQGKFLNSRCGSEKDHSSVASCTVCGEDRYQDELGKDQCKVCTSGLKILDDGKDQKLHLSLEGCQDPSLLVTPSNIFFSRISNEYNHTGPNDYNQTTEQEIVANTVAVPCPNQNGGDVPCVVVNTTYNYEAKLTWDFSALETVSQIDEAVRYFEVQISDVDTFLGDDVHILKIKDANLRHIQIDHNTFTQGANNDVIQLQPKPLSKLLLRPLWHTVIFARVRSVGKLDLKGAWSKITTKWIVGASCTEEQFLEDDNITVADNWKCEQCPDGADCKAKTPYFGVKALMGYNRIETRLFQECLFPGACMGGPNIRMESKFLGPMTNMTDDTKNDFDYATMDLPEQCNSHLGFVDGSRLCHACLEGWRRVSRDECGQCGQQSSNWLLMIAGGFLILAALTFLVLNTIKTAGTTTVSESVQKILINYMQVAALFGNFPLRWPVAVVSLFNIQGGFSTVGEHFVNPDCVSAVGHSSEAELHYAKQIGYFLLPWTLVLLSFAAWKLYARVKKIDFSKRTVGHKQVDGEDLKELTPKDKMVISFCVLVYLLYPTLCGQGFALFNCIRVGKKLYFLIDLQEPCYEGRHFVWALAIGMPQLLLHVVGLPSAGLYMLYRNRHKLSNPVVRARYGLFLGGYKPSRYYWEIVVIVRKVSVVALSIFGTAIRIEIQALMALLLVCGCGVAQLIGNPFQVNEENKRNRYLISLELGSLLVIWLTMWGGVLMFQLDDGDDIDRSLKEMITIFICIMNAVLLLWMIKRYILEVLNENKEKTALKAIGGAWSVGINSVRARTLRIRHHSSAQRRKRGKRRDNSQELDLSKKGHNSTGSGRVVFENPLDAKMLTYLAENGMDGGDEENGDELGAMQGGVTTEESSAKSRESGDSGLSVKPRIASKETKTTASSKKKSEKKKHHTRKSTQLPEGWGKRLTEDGTKYYYRTSDNPNLDSQWEAPEGSYYEERDYEEDYYEDGYEDSGGVDETNGDFEMVKIRIDNEGDESSGTIHSQGSVASNASNRSSTKKRNKHKKGRQSNRPNTSRMDRLETMKEMRDMEGTNTTNKRNSTDIFDTTKDDKRDSTTSRSSVLSFFSGRSSVFSRSSKTSTTSSTRGSTLLTDGEDAPETEYNNPLRAAQSRPEDDYSNSKGALKADNTGAKKKGRTVMSLFGKKLPFSTKKGKKLVGEPSVGIAVNDQSAAQEDPAAAATTTTLDLAPLRPTHHTRDSTRLPPDWAKAHTEEGDKYYFNKSLDESQWKPPEGSTGGSAERRKSAQRMSVVLL